MDKHLTEQRNTSKLMKTIYTYIPKKNESMQLEIKRKSFRVLRDLNKTLKLKKKKKVVMFQVELI